jgi:hypothetical protein
VSSARRSRMRRRAQRSTESGRSGRRGRSTRVFEDRAHPLQASVETFAYRFDDPAAFTRSLKGVSTLYAGRVIRPGRFARARRPRRTRQAPHEVRTKNGVAHRPPRVRVSQRDSESSKRAAASESGAFTRDQSRGSSGTGCRSGLAKATAQAPWSSTPPLRPSRESRSWVVAPAAAAMRWAATASNGPVAPSIVSGGEILVGGPTGSPAVGARWRVVADDRPQSPTRSAPAARTSRQVRSTREVKDATR